ncbi:MAG: DUF58 domain-containing protein [Armatimonadetes bacterium]|nr:DUF58 domain-containing protein [Armatimonadota bacterium]
MLSVSRSPRFTTLLFGALFIYFVAVLFSLPSLFFMAAALVIAPAVSYLLAALGLREIRGERRIPSRLWPDEKVEVEIRLENRALLPKCLLRIDEDLPDGLGGDEASPPGCVVPMLWGDLTTCGYPLIARYRGRYRLAPLVATAVDTFDLFRARRQIGPSNEIVVYPRRVPLSIHALHAPTLDGMIRRSRPVASGVDFRGTREYQPGDDLRRIHWRSTARRGRPIVVEFEEPATTDLFIVLDVSPTAAQGEGRENTFETAVTVAASVIEYELEHGNAVGLYLDGPEPTHLALTRERHELLRFLEALALVEADAPRPLAETIARAGELVPHTAVVFLVSTDASAATAAAVTELTRQHAVAYGWIDPWGHPGAPESDAAGFLARLKSAGVAVFAIRRDDIAAGLTQPW